MCCTPWILASTLHPRFHTIDTFLFTVKLPCSLNPKTLWPTTPASSTTCWPMSKAQDMLFHLHAFLAAPHRPPSVWTTPALGRIRMYIGRSGLVLYVLLSPFALDVLLSIPFLLSAFSFQLPLPTPPPPSSHRHRTRRRAHRSHSAKLPSHFTLFLGDS